MAAISIDVLLINNDNDITLSGFQDNRLKTSADDISEYANAATVTFRIVTASGAEFLAAQPMTYKAGSKGVYQGVLEKAEAANLIEHGVYYIEVEATEGTLQGSWREQSVAKYRET